MRTLSLLFLIATLLLSACSTENPELLDTSELEEVQNNENSAREYKPVPKEKAIASLPFQVKFPTNLSFKAEESHVKILDWEQDLKNIVFSIKYHSIEEPKEHIEYIVANFDRFYSHMESSGEFEKIELNDGTIALFKETPLPSSELHWFKNGIEYNLHYNFVFNDENKAKEELSKNS